MRWSNVPIPEAHVAALLAAAGTHALLPLRIPIHPASGRLLGASLLAVGTGVAAWSVMSFGDAEAEREEELITTGAYAVSRNPMYVSWSAGVLGLGFWTRSAWLLAAWLFAVRALDREISNEESRLAARFGPAYEAYRERVPRYLSLSLRRTP